MLELTAFGSQFAIDLVIGFSIVGCCMFVCSIPYILYRNMKKENAEDAANFTFKPLNEVKDEASSSAGWEAVVHTVFIEKDVLEEGKPKEFPSFGKTFTFGYSSASVKEIESNESTSNKMRPK